jgi:peptide/nickel transport system substrate-binding protein
MTMFDSEFRLISDLARGKTSRRTLLQRGAALGLGTAAMASLASLSEQVARAQEASPVAGAATGEITWALSSAPQNIIPFGALALAQWQGKEFLYDSLLEWDEELTILPAVAESYETPDDTTYVFHLRQGTLFHNGNEVKAADVKYSLEMAKDPPEPGGPVPFLGNIDTVEVVDDYTVQVNMTKIDPTIPGELARAGYTPIVPEGIYDQINVLTEGIGAGPYVLTEYVQDNVIVYDAFPDYWKEGVPCIGRITLVSLPDEQSRVSNLRSGEIDGSEYSADVVSTIEGEEGVQVLQGLVSSPQVIHFNTVEEVPWRDARVRQAINKVVDRQLIIDNVFGGGAELTGAIPPGYGDYPLPPERLAELYAVDVEGAQALMEEAGMADGFSVELQAISAPAYHTQIAEVVREGCAQINIEVAVQPLEIGQFADNIGAGTFQWASTARGMRGDPSGYVIDFRSGTSLNVAWFGDGWINEEIDALYDQALTELDQAARVPIYHQIQELIATDVPNLYTVQRYKYVAATDRLTGMYVFFGNSNQGLRTACISEE